MTVTLITYNAVDFDADKYPFGKSKWPDMYIHKRDDKLVFVYDSQAIAELYKDNGLYLLFGKDMYPSVNRRWTFLFNGANVSFSTSMKRRANGLEQRAITIHYPVNMGGHPSRHIVTTSTAAANGRVKVEVKDGKVVLTPADHVQFSATKDNTAYRAFNQKLKKLRAVIAAKVRMNAYAEYGGTYHGDRTKLRETLSKVLMLAQPAHYYIPRNTVFNRMYNDAIAFLDTQDASLVDAIVLGCLYLHESGDDDPVQNCLRRVNAGMVSIQTHYLRNNCVKIKTSKNSLSLCDVNDQDSELQPSPGLREVQVPSEAEVC